jgi:hsdS, type I site-specific deoxyribonuclease
MSFDESTLYNIYSKLNGKRYPLYDLALWKNGLAFKKIHFSDDGVPVIKIAELNNGISGNTSYTKQIFSDDVHLKKEDLLFSWSGNPQTSIDIFKFQLQEGWLNQHIFKVTPNEEIVDRDYFYFLMKYLKPWFTQIASNKQTTGLGHVTIADIKRMSVLVPSLTMQKKIVDVLKPINDKIQINASINNNLTQQAKTIYQAWFEKFILSNGSCPPTWKRGVLADIANISSGKRPQIKSDKKIKGFEIPLVGATSIVGFTNKANYTNKILVIGRVGTHGIIQRINSPCWASDNTLVLTSKLYEYTFQVLQKIDYHAINRGSTQPLITQADMNKVDILIPDNQILTKFESTVGQLMQKYEANLMENTKLAELRDYLLPRLMSGELDINI